MAKPKLNRANVAEIRELHTKWPRKYTAGTLCQEFGVTVPTILAVLAGEYKPLEDYLEAQNVVCTACGARVHPSIAIYSDHMHEHSAKPWHCKACWEACTKPVVVIPGKPRRITYSVIVRDPSTWNARTGIHTLLRECGHKHLKPARAEACARKLLHRICDHGRRSGARCKHCHGIAQVRSWSADWHNYRIEDSTGQVVPGGGTESDERTGTETDAEEPGEHRFRCSQLSRGAGFGSCDQGGKRTGQTTRHRPREYRLHPRAVPGKETGGGIHAQADRLGQQDLLPSPGDSGLHERSRRSPQRVGRRDRRCFRGSGRGNAADPRGSADNREEL